MPIHRTPLFLPALLLVLLGSAGTVVAQHRHINAGAVAPQAGSKLSIANRASFDADSGFLVHLAPTNHPVYGPIFLGGSDVTFTSLPSTADYGGPDPKAAQPGAHLVMVLVSLSGPTGGALSFWDSFDGFFVATEITFTVPVGTTGGTGSFALSENDGSAGLDPYGHIHGRRFSVDRPGLYTVGFVVVDTSANGLGGGPLHPPSDPVSISFQAGTTIADLKLSADGTTARFGTDAGKTYFVEATDALVSSPVWTTVAGPVVGTDRLESASIPGPSGSARYFRLRVE